MHGKIILGDFYKNYMYKYLYKKKENTLKITYCKLFFLCNYSLFSVFIFLHLQKLKQVDM